MAFASCQKENTEVFPIEQKTKQLVTQKISLTYTINEEHFKEVFYTEDECRKFVYKLLNISRQYGTVISINAEFEKPNYAPEEGKVTETATFDNEEEALAWVMNMMCKEYEVTFNFNEKEGKYIGTATKKEPRTTTTVSTERDSDSM